MLSLRRCRELLGNECPLSDEEVKTLRDQLYAVARIALEMRRANEAEEGASDAQDGGHSS